MEYDSVRVNPNFGRLLIKCMIRKETLQIGGING